VIDVFSLQTEKYYVKYNGRPGVWIDKPVMVREDGVKLMETGHSRDKQAHFLYTDRDVSFEIIAQRYDIEYEPTDTWNVYLGLSLQLAAAKLQRRFTLAKVKEIAANVEEALRAWPPQKLFESTPVREVRFLMKHWDDWDPGLGETL
jgi:hypothetical protein